MDASALRVLQYGILQSIAESYLDGVDLRTIADNEDLRDRLRNGSNHYAFEPASGSGRTRLTEQQIKWFFENFEIVNHYANDASGFSATVFLNRDSGEYTISLRSTEYADENRGGDWMRDGLGGAGGGVNAIGVALAQVASMESYLENLRQGRRLDPLTGRWVMDPTLAGLSQALSGGTGVNVTGYSLGGHLGNVLTVLHGDLVRHTYLFNAAGLGRVNGLGPTSEAYADALRETLALYKAMLFGAPQLRDRIVETGEITPNVFLSTGQRLSLSAAIDADRVRPPDPNRIYSSAVYGWLVNYLESSMIGAGVGPLPALLAGLTTQGLAIAQLEEKLRNYRASRDEFGNLVPDAFDTELYEFTNEKVTSVYGKSAFFDPELVANTGYHPKSQAVYIEDQPLVRGLGGFKFLPGNFGETHSITLLIDSLTVLDLLQGLDPLLTPETYRAMESSVANSVRVVNDRSPESLALKAALAVAQAVRVPLSDAAAFIEANTNSFELNDADAMELTVKSVGDLLGVDLSVYDLGPKFEGGGFADLVKRNHLHDAIAALKDSDAYKTLKGNALFLALTGMSADEILIGAMAEGGEGLAYRYALDRLNPFVVLTDASVYARHNEAHELDRWAADPEHGRMTDEYLRDRAAFLYWKAKLAAYNKVAVEHDGAFDLAYEDLGTGATVDLIARGQGPTPEHRFVRFAATQGSVVLGGNSIDTLYGSAGGDRVEGRDGDDYLEGGEGPDKLSGGSGKDLILGGAGEDELVGGLDADTLVGGAGADTYVINSGEGTDTIRDTGRNYIKWNGRVVAGLFEQKDPGGPYRFITSDSALRDLTLTFNSPATLSDGSGAALVFENYESPEAFEDGDFGIRFLEETQDPVTTWLRVGDDDDNVFEGWAEGERIEARGGMDEIYGFGGDDHVDAGDGDDRVYGDGDGGAGNDLLIGGLGSDIIIGDRGTDRLYGDQRVDLAEAIAEESATSDPARGDWLAAGEGDDLLIGSAASDVLTGGGGEDVLVGGAGADFLMGDADYRPANRGWEFSVRTDGRASASGTASAEVSDPPSSAADVIYGAAGDDWAWAGLGDDLIYGGDGGDQLFGSLGSDVIEGGDGDDLLAAGGRKGVDLADPGDDYLSGGSGNDTLYGSAGDAFLFGDDGDDVILAGPGSDFIDGGAGNDRISAQGADVAYGGDGDDQITAFGTQTVALYGGEGADLLRGAEGEDALSGGAGDDVLNGDENSDVLDGGTGDDRYVLAPGSGVDEIYDESGEDVIEIQSFEGFIPELAVARESIRLIDDDEGGIALAYGTVDDEASLGPDPLGLIERVELKHWTGSTFTIEVIEFAELWEAYLGPTAQPNSGPDLAQPLPEGTATEDESFSYVIPADAFFDPDPDDLLSYTASLSDGGELPGWLGFDPTTRTFFGVPTNADVGSVEVSVTATDLAGASAAGGFLILVANANDAPRVAGSIGSQAVEEESRFELALPADLFTDEDAGDALLWSAGLANGEPLPGWLAFDPQTKTLIGTPTRADVGAWSLAVSVRDDADAVASLAFDLAVTKAPGRTLSGGAGSEVLEGGAGGDDTLLGSAGADAMIGGKGDDTFVLASDGAWSAGYAAYNAGSPGNPGTGRIVAIQGKARLFDTLDGGEGLDTVRGTAGPDALFLDDGLSPFPGAASWRLADVERFLMGAGNDAVDLTSFDVSMGAVRIEGEDGDDLLWASAGDDTLLGGLGRDELYGGAGADYLVGGAGDDSLDGAYGADALQGGEGNDTLLDASGGALLDGGAGNDALTGGSAPELFAGGKGSDSLRPGGGNDVVLFNRGDGADRIAPGSGAKTLSLGGGIAYEDLALERTANRLVVHLGSGETIELTDWYASAANTGFRYMQVVAGAMAGFDPAGEDPLRDEAVERFDFQGLVAAFDAARAADAMITRWQAMHALFDAHLGGSDDEALGGESAYRYGTTGTLGGQSIASAQSALASPDFGSKAQAIAGPGATGADPLLG